MICLGAFADEPQENKRHIVTLSFDDGFKKSSLKTAEIYEKHNLCACINVVASAHMTDFRPPDYHTVSRGDFALWNELQARGHEVMPHSFKHANLQQIKATYLDRLLGKLVALESVDVLPAGRALDKYIDPT